MLKLLCIIRNEFQNPVCLFVNTRPAGTRMYIRIIIVAILQVSIIPSTRPHAPASLSQNPTRGPIKAKILKVPELFCTQVSLSHK
jgi:hypothetical protein